MWRTEFGIGETRNQEKPKVTHSPIPLTGPTDTIRAVGRDIGNGSRNCQCSLIHPMSEVEIKPEKNIFVVAAAFRLKKERKHN